MDGTNLPGTSSCGGIGGLWYDMTCPRGLSLQIVGRYVYRHKMRDARAGCRVATVQSESLALGWTPEATHRVSVITELSVE